MAYIIPLYGQNIYTAATLADVSVEELLKMKSESESKYKEDKNREWAIAKFGKDEEWFEATMKKVEAIRLTLPDDINHKEKTKRLYGWIAKEVHNVDSSIPMEMDKEYSKAMCIELILTDPDRYLKIIHWD
ncbi:MAG: hypothetical protein L0Y61_07175 [Epsilonproteobacteria bacterium]|nr:hypothetical protein [Campylobacterota bacterium]